MPMCRCAMPDDDARRADRDQEHQFLPVSPDAPRPFEIDRQNCRGASGGRVGRPGGRVSGHARRDTSAERSKSRQTSGGGDTAPDRIFRPLELSAAWIAKARSLPAAGGRGDAVRAGVPLRSYDAGVLTSRWRRVVPSRPPAAAAGNPRLPVTGDGELPRKLNELGSDIEHVAVDGGARGIDPARDWARSARSPKQGFEKMHEKDRERRDRRGGGVGRSDERHRDARADVLAPMPNAAEQYRAGKRRLRLLVGQVLKSTRGGANSRNRDRALRRELDKGSAC